MGQDNQEEKQSLIVKTEVGFQPPTPYPDYAQQQGQGAPQPYQPPPQYPPQFQQQQQQHYNQQPPQPYQPQPYQPYGQQQEQQQQNRQSYEATAPPQYQAAPPPQYPPPQGYQAPGYGTVSVGGTGAPVTKVINCRVCQVPITYNPSSASFVKCNMCQHATQVGPPPAGKNFMICKCNTLLTYNLTSRAITCPKAECKSTIVLAPPASGQMRASCAHCNQLLTFTNRASFIQCSKCHRRSMVNRSKWYTLVSIFMILGLVFLGAGIGLTVVSYHEAEEEGGFGYPIFFWGLILSGILFLLRGFIYLAFGMSAPNATNVGV